MTLLPVQVFCQTPKRRMADVTILIVNAWGTGLPKASVRSFVDEKGKDWHEAFVEGKASNIPFGTYRLTAEDGADGFGDSEAELEISSQKVFVRLGLDWLGLENDGPIAHFRGVIQGRILSPSDSCRASGLFLRRSYDSLLDPATKMFDFGLIRTGVYMLTCIISGDAVSLGSVTLSASTPAFSFDLTSHRLAEKP